MEAAGCYILNRPTSFCPREGCLQGALKNLCLIFMHISTKPWSQFSVVMTAIFNQPVPCQQVPVQQASVGAINSWLGVIVHLVFGETRGTISSIPRFWHPGNDVLQEGKLRLREVPGPVQDYATLSRQAELLWTSMSYFTTLALSHQAMLQYKLAAEFPTASFINAAQTRQNAIDWKT